MRHLPFQPRTTLIAALVAGAIAGAVAVGSVIRMAGVHDPDQWENVAPFLAGTLLAFVCVPIAVSAERALHPKRSTISARPPTPAPSLAAIRRKHRREWMAVIAGLILFPCVAIGLIVGAFSYHDQADMSQFTQQHGVPRSSTVLSVQNTSEKGGYISQIQVRLAMPVSGQTETTVYVTHKSVVSEGRTLAVLVDPDRPDYAELPGQPYTSAESWIVALIFAAVGVGFTGFYVKALTTMLRRQRAYREMLNPVQAA